MMLEKLSSFLVQILMDTRLASQKSNFCSLGLESLEDRVTPTKFLWNASYSKILVNGVELGEVE